MVFSKHSNTLLFKVNKAMEYSQKIISAIETYNKVEKTNNDLTELELELTNFNKKITLLDFSNKEDIQSVNELLNNYTDIFSKETISELLSILEIEEIKVEEFKIPISKKINF